MLSRRNLRVKVMQSIYAYEQDAFPTAVAAEKNLQKSITLAYHLFLYHLHVLTKVAAWTHQEAEIKASKHIPTEADKNFSTRLADNPIITALNEDESFNKMVKNFKFELFENHDEVRSLFRKLAESKVYTKYLSAHADDLKAEINVLVELSTKVMPEHEAWIAHLQETFSNWEDDETSIHFKLKNWLEGYNANTSIGQIADLGNTKEEIDFARELFDKTNANSDEFMQMIEPKLKNWDVDRIATVDMILMKMALCELLHFSHIPVKVTINEYIDISKLYSTPKSKDFINGVLDKLMRQLKEEGKINKTGRGLMG